MSEPLPTAESEWSEPSVLGNKECYYLRVVLGAGSLGKSSRVCSVLCVRFRSSVETNKATADTRCTEPPHGASSAPYDRLGRDMLEDPGFALYRRLKGIGNGGPARFPTPIYKKNVGVVAPSSMSCVGVRPGSTLAAPPPRRKRAG